MGVGDFVKLFYKIFDILQKLYFIKRVFLQKYAFFTNNIDLFYKNIAKIQERKKIDKLEQKMYSLSYDS